MRKLLLSTAAAIVAVSGSALAADLPARGAAIAPAPVFVAMNWAGFYVGAQLGGVQGNDKAQVLIGGVPIAGFGQSYSATAVTGGVYAGYNWQFNNIVLGLEADVNLSGLNKSVTRIGALPLFAGDSVRVKQDVDASLVAKLGYSFGNGLIYLLGGATYANFETRYNLAGTLGVTQSNSDGRMGWTIGAGAAYRFTPNWSARLEYRYSDFGKQTHLLAAGPFSVRHERNTHRVMAGLTYHFWSAPSAVVAKY